MQIKKTNSKTTMIILFLFITPFTVLSQGIDPPPSVPIDNFVYPMVFFALFLGLGFYLLKVIKNKSVNTNL